MTGWEGVTERFAEVGWAVLNYLPNLLVGITLLAAGWVLAIGLRWLFLKVLVALQLDRAMSRIGYSPNPRSALGGELSTTISYLVYWFALLLALVFALEVMGLRMTQVILDQIGTVLANVVVAVVVLLVGGLIAMLLGEIVLTLSSHAGVRHPVAIARLAKWIAMGFVLILAFRQLEVAAEFVFTVIEIVVAAVAFAAALAFGLGCKDIARDIVVELFKREDDRGV